MLGDLAFLPIEVLLVTIIIHQLLGEREKKSKLRKLNMVIGAFFSEVGTELLRRLGEFSVDHKRIREELLVDAKWTDQRFLATAKNLRAIDYKLDSQSGDMADLQQFLVERRAFLLRLLENPNLLEHTVFTDMLFAVFHLTEELENRVDLKSLPQSDYHHLSGDMRRAYVAVVYEWLEYMGFLKNDYPYLFSLAMRINPFNPDAKIEVLD